MNIKKKIIFFQYYYLPLNVCFYFLEATDTTSVCFSINVHNMLVIFHFGQGHLISY